MSAETRSENRSRSQHAPPSAITLTAPGGVRPLPRRLLDAPDLKSPVGYRDKALLETVYATGIRTKEMVKLKVTDFDAKARTISG